MPGRVRADAQRLRQILVNLLGNAVKFTKQGGIALRLRSVADGTRLRFEVADTGLGVPAAQRHHLFQEFDRIGVDDAAPVEGAGLGLSVSSRLAAWMGGGMGHEDNPAGGSVFWLELPLVACAAAALPPAAVEGPAAPVGPEGSAAPHSLSVLVVDDIAMNRDIAAAFLRAAGHLVVCAAGGAEAVGLAAARDFDVILMDVRMPEVDGLEATRRIRAMAGARGRVMIVALTAQAFSEQVAICRAAGMDDHLAKPFSPDSLLESVTRAAAAGLADQRNRLESRSPGHHARMVERD
jgi:CheY-like chemotaxis protein